MLIASGWKIELDSETISARLVKAQGIGVAVEGEVRLNLIVVPSHARTS